MRSPFTCLTVFLLLLSTSASSNNRGTPWQVSWPFFQNADVPHSLTGGYGDWCVIDEGAHPGLDFGAITGDSVLVPADIPMYALRIFEGDLGYTLVFGTDPTSQEGWGVTHLSMTSAEISDWQNNIPVAVTTHQPLAPCFQYGTNTPLHMHLQWLDNLLPGSPPGLHNPFDFFTDNLSGYDEIQFNPVRWEGYKKTGAWFMPDGTESAAQISVLTDYQLFQDIISGAVDIAVAPFSAFQGSSDQDMAGVYSVSYEILRMNPHTHAYEPAAPDEGNFRERHLMEMRDEIPHGDSPGYRALFPDGYLYTGGALDPFWNYNMNAYIVTNSKALPPSSWTTGWDNIYTDINPAYVNDWEDGICQGAWDTFLAKQDFTGGKRTNRSAFFPDGRYAVEVNAVSHGARESDGMILPVDDLDRLFPATEGIIVDNYLPGVGVVIVYSKSGSSVDPKYMAKWRGEGSSDNSEYQEQLAYLEELHEDLCFFQCLERGEEVAVPESFQIDPDLPGGFIAGASFSTALVSSGNTASEVNSVCTEVEGYGVSSDAGIDPVVFLREEIARVEGELDSYGNRDLHVSQYGYIPYGGASSVDGESLNMLVIYSEPTMVRNSSGQIITDKIYMLGYIHENTIWDSRNHGTFVRDTPAGNAEHTAYLQEQMGSAFPSEPDAEYAVHYIFQGDLPSEFCGTVQMFIGTDTRSSTVGPRDLAGHLMDVDPTTIPATRKGYESWASVSLGMYPGYESQSDPHYQWGVPRWTPGRGKVYATIGSDTVAVVDLASIGMGGSRFFGGCFPWYGFWLYKDTDGEHGFNVPVVRHNGTIRHHVFTTKYPKGDPNEDSMFWAGGPGEQERAVSLDQQYFWVTGSECNTLENFSTAFVYSVNSETGATNIHEVCSGWCTGPFSGDYTFYCSGTAVMKIYESGAALIIYSYFPYPWSEPIIGYKAYNPPGGGNMDFSDEPCLAVQTEDLALSNNEPFIVLSNPVNETLDVEIACASWNLSVFDISGRCVVSESGVSTEDRSVVSIDAGMLPSGVYILKVEIEGVEEVQSFSIVH